MPVQETAARLWFETEQEAQDYDTKMISNIEIKEGDDPDSPHFSYLASRARKEKFPTYSQKYMDAYHQIMTIDESKKRLDHSYRYWHHFTLEKYFFGMGLTYLVVRELPIRNFFARAIIMGFIGGNLYSNYRFRGILSGTRTNMIIDEDPDIAL